MKNRQNIRCNKKDINGNICKNKVLSNFNTCYEHIKDWDYEKIESRNKIKYYNCNDNFCYYCYEDVNI